MHTLDNFSFTWKITIINFNRTLESLGTKDNLTITTNLINRVMKYSTKSTSHCCFRKAVSNNYFQKFLQINFVSTCSNWLNNFSFTHFLLVKGYGKHSLRKESVIAPFIEWFKTARESAAWILFAQLYLQFAQPLHFSLPLADRLSTGCFTKGAGRCSFHKAF